MFVTISDLYRTEARPYNIKKKKRPRDGSYDMDDSGLRVNLPRMGTASKYSTRLRRVAKLAER